MASSTVLVTGAAGFVGFHVAKRLLRDGYRVVGFDNFNDYYHPALKEARAAILAEHSDFSMVRADLADLDAVRNVFAKFEIERVCHLAAQAGVRYSLENPYAYERSNLSGFLNILEMVRHSRIRRLVYASSSSVYGGNTKVPFSESDRVDSPISLYAATKKANELMAHCYSHLFGIQTVGLRFFTVYGPWGRPDMAMWLFTEAIRAGRPIHVFNFGDMRRDFTYVDDIVEGVCASLFRDGLEPYEVFNLGNNHSENLLDMISTLEHELGATAKKEMLPLQAGDVPETTADIELAQRKLGFRPKTRIAEGIRTFVRWYDEHSELTSLVSRRRNETK
jgi:UDP-glucuronate 4-epimerase